jgi:hypothetical protein
VDDHLSESVPQLRSWIVHNKKLILHSVRVAKAQAKLHTHQIQRFFPRQGVRQSNTATIRLLQAPRRHRTTRISNFFTALTRPSSRNIALLTVSEDTELTLTAPQRRLIRRRQLNIPDLFPDHPG